MKREAWNHPKIKLLCRDLKLPLCYVNGILESIWLVTGSKLPSGDIGRWSNEEIAAAIEYPNDPDELIAALLKRRFLDPLPDDKGRLYVHDWHEHCDQATKRKLDRWESPFADGHKPKWLVKTRHNRQQLVTTILPEPEPEPEPEPVNTEVHTRSDNHASNGKEARAFLPAWKSDQRFVEFSLDYLKLGKHFIDKDFERAYDSWQRLDLTQRMERVKGLLRRSEEYSSDPAFIPFPKKFLDEEWERLPKPKPNGSPRKPKTVFEQRKEQIEREKQQQQRRV